MNHTTQPQPPLDTVTDLRDRKALALFSAGHIKVISRAARPARRIAAARENSFLTYS